MFCIGNTDADKNIIDMNDYLDKKIFVQNENLIDQEDSNAEPVNSNIRKSLKDQFTKAYKKTSWSSLSLTQK